MMGMTVLSLSLVLLSLAGIFARTVLPLDFVSFAVGIAGIGIGISSSRSKGMAGIILSAVVMIIGVVGLAAHARWWQIAGYFGIALSYAALSMTSYRDTLHFSALQRVRVRKHDRARSS